MHINLRNARLAALAALSTVCLGTAAVAQDKPAEAKKEQAVETATTNTAAAKPEKITDRSHPDYIRCRRERVMGSLAQKRKICMTNAEWKAYAAEGNRGANELVEDNRGTSLPGG